MESVSVVHWVLLSGLRYQVAADKVSTSRLCTQALVAAPPSSGMIRTESQALNEDSRSEDTLLPCLAL